MRFKNRKITTKKVVPFTWKKQAFHGRNTPECTILAPNFLSRLCRQHNYWKYCCITEHLPTHYYFSFFGVDIYDDHCSYSCTHTAAPHQAFPAPVREPCKTAKELHIHPTEKPLILGHIPDISAAAIEKSSLQGGIYDIECIGGNHTREAIKGLRSDDPQNDYLKFWPVRLYAGLTDQQALAKGHLHNMRHKLARQTTFEELVTYFGTELSHVLKGAQLLNDDGAFLQQIPHKAILQWKRLLCTVIFQKPVSFSIL